MTEARRNDWIERSHASTVRVLKLVNRLPRSPVGYNVAGQFTRSSMGIPYNLEEAKAAHTEPDTLAKMSAARKESAETRRAFMIIRDVPLLPSNESNELGSLIQEANAWVAMPAAGVLRLGARIRTHRKRSAPGDGRAILRAIRFAF